MAGIDKIYGTLDQLFEFRKWLHENKREYLVYVTDPSQDIAYYRKHFKEVVISNFPEKADKWLYKHCPLQFVKKRIGAQYGGKP